MADLVLRGGTVVTPTEVRPADVVVAGGAVADLLPPGAPVEAGEEYDAAGCLVLPGAIDAHVHFRTPGLEHKEDWGSGSAAAVAGGVTTVLDMPNTLPPTATGAALADKAARVEGRSWCHYGFYGALAAGGLGHLEGLAEAGAIGFKVFLGESTASLPPPDDGELLQALRLAARLGLRTMVHAENAAILRWAAGEQTRGGGSGDLRAHGRSRPAVAEVEAVVRTCLLAAEAGAPVCIAHLSTAGGAEAVRRAKASGHGDLWAETCPHYLLLTEDEAVDLGALAKVNPPLRGPVDREALWAAVADGTVDTLGSDHAPHAAEEKAAGVAQAPAGFAGVQNTLPLLLGHPRLPLRRLVELVCEGPARAWGLWPRKGRIARGADADLVVVRPVPPRQPVRQWSRNPASPLLILGTMRAEVVATLVAGHVAYREGQLVGRPRGRWVRP